MSATYQAKEQSVAEGAPIEAYRFIGTFREYLYTSADVPITLDGNLYEPITIKRNAIRAGTSSEDNLDLELTVPSALELVLDYVFAIAPPDLDVVVYRFHAGTDPDLDRVVYWTGRVAGIALRGPEARVLVPSVFGSLLSAEIPTVYYQTPCNHVLFDSGCKVSRAANEVVTTVSATDGTSVTLASAGGFPDGHFVGGEAVSEGGERRMVVSHASNLIRVNFPYSNLLEGEGITVSAGCDHSHATCIAKFANAINYGGFPFIPSVNPFAEGI
jgi:uncharacterized phage protein (TIGR02218 family)